MSGAWSGRRVVELTRLVLATYGVRCHLCGRLGATTADHVVPRRDGGSDDLLNLRPAHLSCNSARGAMPLAQWFERHPLPAARAAPSLDWSSPPTTMHDHA